MILRRVASAAPVKYLHPMPDAPEPRRSNYQVLRAIPTRWMDNDHYGHVNNVAYYSYFDTAVNGFLIEAARVDIRELPAIGLVVESGCNFLRAASFPDTIHAGLAVETIGNSSVVYAIALFRNDEDTPCAVGRFVHVYVDRDTRRPAPIPNAVKAVVGQLKRV